MSYLLQQNQINIVTLLFRESDSFIHIKVSNIKHVSNLRIVIKTITSFGEQIKIFLSGSRLILQFNED